MKRLFKIEWNKLMKQTQTIYSIVLLLLFGFIMGIYTINQTENVDNTEVASDFGMVTQVTNTIKFQDIKNVDEIESLLIQLEQELSRQTMFITMEIQNGFLESSLESIQIQKKLAQYDEQREYLSFIPSDYELSKQEAYFQYLIDYQLPYHFNTTDSMQSLTIFLPILITALTIYLLFMASQLSLDEQTHAYLVKSYPYTNFERIAVQVANQMVFYLILFVLAIASFILTVASKTSFGDIHYPTSLLLYKEIWIVPVWLYALLIFFYFLFVTLFINALSFVLNQFSKQYFQTFILLLFCLLIGYIGGTMIPIPLQPFSLLLIPLVLNGYFNFPTTYLLGTIILFITAFCLFLLGNFLKKTTIRRT